MFLFNNCGGSNSDSPESAGGSNGSSSTKTYLGMTPLPPSYSIADLNDVYSKLSTNTNLIAHHFDDGIPWNEALTDTYPYDNHIMNDWSTRKTKTPAGHKVYVAVTPISFSRDGLAPYRKNADNMAWVSPFDTHGANKAFDHIDVKTAYLNYCRRVINYFNPDFFAFGIEVNLVRKASSATFNKYLQLHQYVYTQLKAEFPNLPIFASVVGSILMYGYEDPTSEFSSAPDPKAAYQSSQQTALTQILQYSDYYAISFYPYATAYYNSPFPADMLSTLFSYSSKPLAIAETGVLAADVVLSFVTLPGTPTRQRDYFADLISQVKARQGKFIVNFVPIDYDQLCSDMGGCSDIMKLWLKCGFWDENKVERPVLSIWRANL